MVLRSHTKAAMRDDGNGDGTTTTKRKLDTNGDKITAAEPQSYAANQQQIRISDRDFQECMSSKQPFYNAKEVAKEEEYPYETFTHQSYFTMICSNRLSVKTTLEQEDERKREASKQVTKVEMKQLMDVKAFQPVLSNGMSEDTKKKVIPSHVFLKEKLLADKGVLIK